MTMDNISTSSDLINLPQVGSKYGKSRSIEICIDNFLFYVGWMLLVSLIGTQPCLTRSIVLLRFN